MPLRRSGPRWRSRAQRMALKVAIEPPGVRSPAAVSGNCIHARNHARTLASSWTSAGAGAPDAGEAVRRVRDQVGETGREEPAAGNVGHVARGAGREGARNPLPVQSVEQRLQVGARLGHRLPHRAAEVVHLDVAADGLVGQAGHVGDGALERGPPHGLHLLGSVLQVGGIPRVHPASRAAAGRRRSPAPRRAGRSIARCAPSCRSSACRVGRPACGSRGEGRCG